MPWSRASSPPNPIELFRVVVVQLELAALVKGEPRADPPLALRRLALACFEQNEGGLARVAGCVGDRLARRGGARGGIAYLPRFVARLGQADHHVEPLPVVPRG